MLVLLIVFIVLVPTLAKVSDAALPTQGPPPPPGSEVPLVLSLDAQGQPFLQQEALAWSEIQARLVPPLLLQPRGARKVFLKVAGDLPHTDGRIDTDALDALVKANQRRRGWLYTHHDTTIQGNQEAIAGANALGLTVNLSADSLENVDRKYALGIGPVVTLLPKDAGKVTYTPEGRRVVRCPQTHNKQVTCSSCGICQKAERSAIIGFPVHGVRWKAAERIFSN